MEDQKPDASLQRKAAFIYDLQVQWCCMESMVVMKEN